jgi:hypothetical protein
MQDLLLMANSVLGAIPEVLTGVVLVATVVARFTKTPKDDEVVSKLREFLLKALRYAPTIGVNPQTKKLEEALKK